VPEVPVDGNVRTEVLPPDRLNTVVSAGLAAVALAIAVVGVAGLLAFLVSGRKREFGMRLAIGSQARHLVANVVGQGTSHRRCGRLKMPGVMPVAGSACILVMAALSPPWCPRSWLLALMSWMRFDPSKPLCRRPP